MVPGSTLRYGSSFWRETLSRRAFRMFPIEAAVMPLPREETTPPVTKTYFDMDDLQGGFTEFTGKRPSPPSGEVGAERRVGTPTLAMSVGRQDVIEVRLSAPGPRPSSPIPRRTSPAPTASAAAPTP